MNFTVCSQQPNSSDWMDSGESYLKFDSANEAARNLFEDYVGIPVPLRQDALYEDETGLKVGVFLPT